jgi:hypothetical protein
MLNETEQRFLLREIENLKQRLEKLEIQEKGIVVWKSWTPSSYYGWSALPTGTYIYCVIGGLLVFAINMTDGDSNSTAAEIALPLTVKNNNVFGGVCGLAYDNGQILSAASRWYVDNTTSRVLFRKDMGSTLWTASGKKYMRCVGFAEV